MNLIFDDNEQDYAMCQEAYNELNPEEAMFMNHYELAADTGIAPDVWKRFLQHHKVADWMKSEMNVFKQAQMKKLIKKTTTESKSVGTAQMINALSKNMDDTTQKDGPVFVYCYIPLNQDELHAPNVRVMATDPFLEEVE